MLLQIVDCSELAEKPVGEGAKGEGENDNAEDDEDFEHRLYDTIPSPGKKGNSVFPRCDPGRDPALLRDVSGFRILEES